LGAFFKSHYRENKSQSHSARLDNSLVITCHLDALRRAGKGFCTFEQSVHSPIFEEPTTVRLILREDVLWATTRLVHNLPR